MPGIGDPSTYLMPQQPIHRAVFKMGSRHGKMLSLVTNPYQFTLEGVHVLGTSGESNQIRIDKFINSFNVYVARTKYSCFHIWK